MPYKVVNIDELVVIDEAVVVLVEVVYEDADLAVAELHLEGDEEGLAELVDRDKTVTVVVLIPNWRSWGGRSVGGCGGEVGGRCRFRGVVVVECS